MKSRSITRRLIIAVLLLELLAALALVALATFHESSIRFRAFDATLQSRAATLLGAVGEADDPANVMLDTRGITIPKRDLYSVTDETGRILGQSPHWLKEPIDPAVYEALFRVKRNGQTYRFVHLQGTRIIDPGDKNGGVIHHITLLYGAPTGPIWHEVREAVSFYTFASLVLLTLTGIIMAWFLRRGLAPLRELADEAGRVSAHQWQFTPPESARTTRELAPLADAIEAALLRLQQTFQQQRRFTSDAAHELKTDVAIVKSSLQLLSMRPRAVDEYQEGLEVALRDCNRLESTVQEMLTLAGMQYTAHQTASPTQASDLARCAQEAVHRFAPLAQLRQINVILATGGAAMVALDEKESTLLCTNLILNAIQHSHPASSVQVGLRSEHGQINLTVDDQGEGIAANILPHVFEPFFRGDASRDRKSGGTGLGLAICKAICERAAGSIEIFSTLNTGTRVLVQLPTSAS
ncbi:MAG: integral rane sensor signal transduction histidine kinase [Acidobacteriaceae bacterium]|nr:integral rane sensor signal transduction histidine kinase [Acidobacteriaceae bacterium]